MKYGKEVVLYSDSDICISKDKWNYIVEFISLSLKNAYFTTPESVILDLCNSIKMFTFSSERADSIRIALGLPKYNNWAGNVYRDDFPPIPSYWSILEKRVFKRDKFICQSCELFCKDTPALLSAHHVLPRSKGGSNILDNLITLCRTCHDEIEDLGFKNKFQIVGYKSDSTKKIYPTGESPVSDWHKKVYGGSR